MVNSELAFIQSEYEPWHWDVTQCVKPTLTITCIYPHLDLWTAVT